MAPMRRFAAIAGTYDYRLPTEGKPIDEDEDADYTYFYAYEDIKKEFLSEQTSWFFIKCEQDCRATVAWYWNLCCVVAPWFKDQVGEVETGVSVDRTDKELWPSLSGWPPSIRYVMENGWKNFVDYPEVRWPDPMSVVFMKLSDFEGRSRKAEHTKGKKVDEED